MSFKQETKSTKFSKQWRLTLSALLLCQLAFAGPSLNAKEEKPAAAPAKTAPTKAQPEKEKEKEKSATPSAAAAKTPEPVLENVVTVTAEDLVNKPQEYLNKNVKFLANFSNFSTLALDYKPAMRSSKTHLSLLVLRGKSHVPLSELKLAMMVPKEKDPEATVLANLKDGDQIEIVGKVFSTALDDPWVEIFKLKKLGGSTTDKVASGTDAKASASDKKADDKHDAADKDKAQKK